MTTVFTNKFLVIFTFITSEQKIAVSKVKIHSKSGTKMCQNNGVYASTTSNDASLLKKLREVLFNMFLKRNEHPAKLAKIYGNLLNSGQASGFP